MWTELDEGTVYALWTDTFVRTVSDVWTVI